MSKTIKLTRGYETLVDDTDFEWLSRYKWYVNISISRGLCYANRQYRSKTLKNKHGKPKQVLIAMHRLIMGVPKGKHIDHINHDSLDNRRENLRVCLSVENLYNQRCGRNRQFKGVRRRSNGRFYVVIMKNGVDIALGDFKSAIVAAKNYDKIATLLFGEFACLNFPGEKIIFSA